MIVQTKTTAKAIALSMTQSFANELLFVLVKATLVCGVKLDCVEVIVFRELGLLRI
jgi:hypothetical protein